MENSAEISTLIQKMDSLIHLIQKDHEFFNKVISKMEDSDDEVASNWVTTANAARLLGLRVPKRGRRYAGTLKFLREKGFITRFREGKPIMYWKPEIQKIAIQISEGKIDIPYLP